MKTESIKIQNLKRNYVTGAETVEALKGISLSIEKGDIVALMGPSGSGKTTLLNLIGCMDKATEGSIVIGGQDISKLSKREMIEIRRKYLGFVFQDNHLIPTLTALENTTLPLLFSKANKDSYAQELLTKVGLGDRLKHRPNQLSGGQNQRVAIARALINKPEIILADEPTGRLDVETKKEIFNVFKKLASEGVTILLATHDNEIAQLCNRVLVLKDGRIINQ